MAIREISISWVLNGHQPVYFKKPGTDDKYKRVATFIVAFLTRNSQCANVSFLKAFLLFRRDLMCLYGTAGAVIKNNFATGMVDIGHKTLHLKYGLLVLLCLAQRRTGLLMQ